MVTFENQNIEFKQEYVPDLRKEVMKYMERRGSGLRKIVSETEKVYAMPFAKIYPMLVAKAVRKGRTQAEVDEIIEWLTDYDAPQIEAAVQNGISKIQGVYM